MPIKTLYFLPDATPPGISAGYTGTLQDGGTAPTGVFSSTGWQIPTTYLVNGYSAMMCGNSQATFGDAADDLTPPSLNGVNDTLKCCRSTNPFTGTFANANWGLTWRIRPGGVGSPTGMSARFLNRVWKSTDPTGTTGAVELTNALQISTTASGFTTGVTNQCVTVWVPNAGFVFNNEYLWVQCEIQVLTAPSGNNGVFFYNDSVFSLSTPNFTGPATGGNMPMLGM